MPPGNAEGGKKKPHTHTEKQQSHEMVLSTAGRISLFDAL